jgi:hypothetical protein
MLLCGEKRKNRGNTKLGRREEKEGRVVYFGTHMCPGGTFSLQKWVGWGFLFFSFFFGVE